MLTKTINQLESESIRQGKLIEELVEIKAKKDQNDQDLIIINEILQKLDLPKGYTYPSKEKDKFLIFEMRKDKISLQVLTKIKREAL